MTTLILFMDITVVLWLMTIGTGALAYVFRWDQLFGWMCGAALLLVGVIVILVSMSRFVRMEG